MGNQPSSEKEKHQSSSRAGTPSDKDKRVSRRQSIPALQVSHTRADTSATNASAIAQTTSRPFEPHDLQQYVTSSPSPESASRAARVIRTASRRKKEPEPAGSSVPVAVPAARSANKQQTDAVTDSKAYEKIWEDRPEPPRYVPPSELRPQRMPLPIANAPTIPESPTLDPVDRGNNDVPIFEADVAVPDENTLRRKSSFMSIGTQDEDDMDDELPPGDPNVTVQTVIEWTHAGNKVYVTGSFASNWEKKYRMHRM
jgi:hypothetical protein